MQGYEKVNKRRVERRVIDTLPVGDGRIAPPSKKRPKARRRLIDLSAIAAETPAESIARENEIVAEFALKHDYAERPAHLSIAEQLQCLVDPEVIRSL